MPRQWEIMPVSCKKKCSPSGVTVLYLKTSIMIALIYGSFSQSSNVGSLSFSVTRSMSSCARCMTDGWSDIRGKKERRVQLVFVAEEVNLTWRRKKKKWKSHRVRSSAVHNCSTIHDELFLLLSFIRRERGLGGNIVEGGGDETRESSTIILSELREIGRNQLAARARGERGQRTIFCLVRMKGSTLHAVKTFLISSKVLLKPESDKKVGQFFTIYLSVICVVA